MTTGPPAHTSYRRLLATPAYLRVFAAGLASFAGSSIAGICLTWIVYADTGSALDVALLGTAWLVGGILFSVVGGTWVDRYDRRRLMVLADFTRAAAMAGVVVVFAVRGFELLPVLAANLVVGSFTTIFSPAEQALVPSLVPSELVADANGLVRSSRSILQFVGASLGGVLIVTVGPLIGVAANAVTFLISGLLIVGMRVSGAGAAPGPGPAGPRRLFREAADGFRWLWSSKGFFEITFSATFFNFCSSLIGTFLVVFATGVLHGSALVYAALLAAEVAGAAVGALLVGRLHAVRWAGRAWVVPYGAVSGLVALALVLVPVAPVAVVALFALGACGGFAGTSWLTAAQLMVPKEMQGRYFGIDSLGSIAILPAAQIGGAFLILAYGVRETYLLAAVAWLIAGVAFLGARSMWRLGYRSEDATPRTDDGAAGTSGSPAGTRDA